MDKQEFLSIAERYYDEFASLSDSADFYEYEKSIDKLFQRITKEYMEKQLNASSSSLNRRKKKHLPNSEKSPS